VTPKAVGGSSGIGPRVIAHPTPAPDGKPGSRVVVLSDRVLTINAVTGQPAANQGSTVIDVDLAVQNSGDTLIQNQSTFFQLIGAGGDAFAVRINGTDPFFDAIDARATRRGSIGFEVPSATTSELRLFYRPEVATEAVIVPLSIASQ
jgi:hypothetical protein